MAKFYQAAPVFVNRSADASSLLFAPRPYTVLAERDTVSSLYSQPTLKELAVV
jgi:hypothetical protein